MISADTPILQYALRKNDLIMLQRALNRGRALLANGAELEEYTVWCAGLRGDIRNLFGHHSDYERLVMDAGANDRVIDTSEGKEASRRRRLDKLHAQVKTLAACVQWTEDKLELAEGDDFLRNKPPEVLKSASQSRETTGLPYIFLSHYSQNPLFAEYVCTLFEKALRLPPNSIRCSSVDGYKFATGSEISSSIRKELQDARVVVGLISRNTKDSKWFTYEMAGRSAMGKKMYMLVAPEASVDDIFGPLRGHRAAFAKNKSEVLQLIEEIASYLDIPRNETSFYYNAVEKLAALAEE